MSAIKVDGRALLPAGSRRRAGRAGRAPGHGGAVRGRRLPPRRRPARRRRRGRVLVRHLRPRAGPRSRRRARRRWPPDRTAAHPRRPVRPRRRPAPWTNSPRRDDPVTLPLAAAVRAALPVRDARRRPRPASCPTAGRSPPAGIAGVYGALAADGTAVALLRDEGDAGASGARVRRRRVEPAVARDGLDDVRALLAGRLPDVRLSVDRDLGGSDRSRVSRVRARFPRRRRQLGGRQTVPDRG